MPLRELTIYPHRRTVIVLGLAVALCVNALSIGLAAWRHHEVMRAAGIELANIASVLAVQSNQGAQGLDVAIQQVSGTLIEAGLNAPEKLKVIAASRAFTLELQKLVSAIDFLVSIAIIDDRGQAVALSRQWPVKALDLSDRDYFKALSAANPPPAYWSAPLRSRLTGQSILSYSKRLVDAHGRFAGIILTVIPVSKIEAYFAAVRLPADSTIKLIRDDGVELVSAPSIAKDRGQNALDASNWIATSSRLADHPLSVVAATPRAVILGYWRWEAVAISGLTLLLNLTIGIAGLLGLRQIEASEAALLSEQIVARSDPLTGLYNRNAFNLYLNELLETFGRGYGFAILIIDLDFFKEVNDALGHAVGDDLLRAVSERLSQNKAETDVLARLGGDEFALLHIPNDDKFSAVMVGERLLKALEEPFELAEGEITVTCSVGGIVAPDDGTNRKDLMLGADLALFQAKQSGRNTIKMFTAELGRRKRQKVELSQDLRDAVKAEKLELFFQPIVDIKSRKITSFEALVRWKDRRRGHVSPTEFIPIAEETGLITRIGSWVLHQACHEAHQWPDSISVSVNLSPQQLRLQDVHAETVAALSAAGIPPSRLILEITESVQLDANGSGPTLRRLKEMGVRVALDDFGTGYASMSYLRSFPFDKIKIDQTFVQDMQRLESRVIVQTVFSMGQQLNIEVVAEGVETVEQLALLRLHGCRKAQGYLFGRPIPAHEVIHFIEAWQFPKTSSGRLAAFPRKVRRGSGSETRQRKIWIATEAEMFQMQRPPLATLPAEGADGGNSHRSPQSAPACWRPGWLDCPAEGSWRH